MPSEERTMTLEALAKEGKVIFSRSTWPEGQFIHAERSYMSRDGSLGGMRLCFCHAPIDGNDPEVEDDLWMAYTGPEAQQMRKGGNVSVLEGIPPALLAIIRLLAENQAESQVEAEVKQHAPETPPWQVGPTMRA
jgi:hypothetical protein